MPPLDPTYWFVTRALRPPIWLWFDWRFEGLEHVPTEGAALFASNHISYFDPIAHGYFMLKRGRYARFLAKSELFASPFLRPLLQGMRHIPVRRGTGDRGPVEFGEKALRNGEIVLVYPESTVTTNPDFSLGRGKTGVARLALTAQVPVIPLAIWGSAPIWQKGSRDLKLGRPIWMKAGPPIDFSEHEEGKDDPAVLRRVTDEVMAELSMLVGDLRARYPKRWT